MSQVRHHVRIAEGARDIRAAQRLRWSAFGGGAMGLDRDAFDDHCQHVLVEDIGGLVATCRIMPFGSGAEIAKSYSAQYYDLSGLMGYPAPMVELGRFCVASGAEHPDVLRAAWGGVARVVEQAKARLLFGCSSFQGTDASAYADTFSMLRERHLAPRRWRPKIKAPRVFSFAERGRTPDRTKALRRMPPLLRSYLSLGGWVSDHAVVDTDLNTLHVFTGVEVKGIPKARVRTLRHLGGSRK